MAPVVLDQFNGVGNPTDWLYRAERYFTFLGFSEEHWLPLPSLYLDGEALEWFRWMFRNEQFFDWNHFKEKFTLCFQKRTYARSHVVDVQITSILALLQKLEDKCSTYTSKQVIADDVSISTATAFSGKINFPIEENSRPVDNIEGHSELFASFIDDHSSHVNNMFDEMSTEDFTKEVVQTSSASSFVPILDDIPSPRVFDECFHRCCPMIVAEVQPDPPIKMLDDEAPVPKHSEVQLFDECSRKDMSRRYVNTTSLDRGFSKQNIEFETLDDMYLTQFFLEPETIEDLYLNNLFLEIEDHIPRSNKPSDELLVVEHGKSTDELCAHNILCNFSFNPGDIVAIHGTGTNLCIWDPGISFKFKALLGYTVNTKPPLLLGSTAMFGFIAYANSVTQVWDPGQQWCMHSSVLLFVLALAAITSLSFSSRDTFTKWFVAYKMIVMKFKVDDPYSEMNRVSDDSFQRAASREIQSIAPVDVIHLLKLFRFLQHLLAQLIFVLQAPKSKVGYAAIGGDFSLQKKIIEQATTFCIACLQGCFKPMANLIEQELRNFSTLEEIMIHFGAQGVPASYATGDKIIDCSPTFSQYEFAALQACENDHLCLTMIESELELVKGASIVDAYVVHKSMLDESNSTSILISCGKFKTTTRFMCYLVHFGGHRRVEEHIVAQQIQLAELGKTSGAAMGPSLLARSRAFLVIILEQNHRCFFLLCETPMEVNKKCRLWDPKSSSYLKQTYCYERTGLTNAHGYVNIKKAMTNVWLSTREQMTIFIVMASVMVLGNMECSKGNEIVSSILQVDSVWFHLCTTITTLSIHSSLGRFNIILTAWLYSNLEDKVLIEDGSIVVNPDSPEAGQPVGPGANPRRGPKVRQPNNRFAWDPG